MFKPIMAFVALSTITACSSAPTHISLQQEQLIPCPSSPNCVSSTTQGSWKMTNAADWQQLLSVLSGMENTELDIHNGEYAHFVVTSQLLGFKDDVELKRSGDEINYRSASRTGYSDFGVNKKRMLHWQTSLRAENLLQP
jgi:uncharacterized protein (DUF1499 family)